MKEGDIYDSDEDISSVDEGENDESSSESDDDENKKHPYVITLENPLHP